MFDAGSSDDDGAAAYSTERELASDAGSGVGSGAPSGVTAGDPAAVSSCGDGVETAAHRSRSAHPTLLVEQAAAAVDRVLAADPAELGDAVLTEHVEVLAALSERVSAALAVAVAAWEPRRTFLADGCHSAHAWLAGFTPVGRRGAARVVRCGRLVREHGEVRRHLVDGEVTAGHVDAMARHASKPRHGVFRRDAALLCRLAASLSVDEFERAMAHWRALADDEAQNLDASAAHEGRHFHLSPMAGGRERADGEFEASDAALLRAAIDAALDPPDAPDVSGGARTVAQRRADAVVAICRAYLEGRPGDGGTPARTVACRVDWDALVRSSLDGYDPELVCEVAPGTPVGRETMRRLLCDSYVARIVTRGRTEPLDLGRATRFFTAAQRRAMTARDGPGCVVPGCRVPAERCEAHHLSPFESGGPTDIGNGAHLCASHHRDVHERGFTLARGPGGGWQLRRPGAT